MSERPTQYRTARNQAPDVLLTPAVLSAALQKLSREDVLSVWLFTLTDAGKLLGGVTDDTVRRWTQDAGLPYVAFGKKRMIPGGLLAEWIKERAVGDTATLRQRTQDNVTRLPKPYQIYDTNGDRYRR